MREANRDEVTTFWIQVQLLNGKWVIFCIRLLTFGFVKDLSCLQFVEHLQSDGRCVPELQGAISVSVASSVKNTCE